jgi:hypothetical protein
MATVYKENPMPVHCPPVTAHEPRQLRVYRLGKNNPPQAQDFKSHIALGITLPAGIDECRARSCSVFDSIDRLNGLRRLPRLREHKVAIELTLDATAGLIEGNSKGHYDWWIFHSYDPCKNSSIHLLT